MEFAGAQLKQGEMIVAPMTLAGMDNHRNPDPARFDIDRQRRQHVSFSTRAAPVSRPLSGEGGDAHLHRRIPAPHPALSPGGRVRTGVARGDRHGAGRAADRLGRRGTTRRRLSGAIPTGE
ncbi:hypothetical protein AB5I41_08755 [Sphingomonas sp. MMS24-JH45]